MHDMGEKNKIGKKKFQNVGKPVSTKLGNSEIAVTRS